VNKMTFSFYWHDYETWGADPQRDRACQFAGVRTNEAFEPIGDPLVLYCKPANDMLPQPQACLVTGITPQKALREGVVEAEFIHRVHQELSKPNTCGVGYNSLRFDDEVTRNTLYRNLYDPYAREWQNGASRWDIIDMARLTHALRPEGIEWPRNDQGETSFRLEALSAANGIEHTSAHDALSDVHATLGLARLIKQQQPRLYDYLFNSRQKQVIAERLNLRHRQAVLHVSAMYPAARGCIAMVVPLLKHPNNPNGVIVYDLRVNPEAFFSLSVEELYQNAFTPLERLPEGAQRLPIKTIHINKCPVVVPMNTLNAEAAQRWSIDVSQGMNHRQRLLEQNAFTQKIEQIFQRHTFEPTSDPDLAIYSGGFFSRNDRQRMNNLIRCRPKDLVDYPLVFDDHRLPEMLFRYRARNWPETLNKVEQARWDEYRQERLLEVDGGGSLTLDEYLRILDHLEADSQLSEKQRAIIPQLLSWAEQIAP
jgi:exodeoxyribonuclease-1